MSKKKLLLLGLGVFFIIACICTLCFAVIFFGFNLVMKDAKVISDEVVVKVCQRSEDLTTSDYEKFFDTNSITYLEASYATEAMFPNDNCDDYDLNSFMDIFSNDFAFNTKNDNGTRTATFEFTNPNDDKVKITFEKFDEEWKIVGISIN